MSSALSSAKWNQWKAQKLQLGKTDDELLITCYNLLLDMGINHGRIFKDAYITIDPACGEHTMYFAQISQNTDTRKLWIHHPDFVIMKDRTTIQYIIEIDGAYHDTQSGQRATNKRNDHYDVAGIPHMTVNMHDCKKYLGMTPLEFLAQNIPVEVIDSRRMKN